MPLQPTGVIFKTIDEVIRVNVDFTSILSTDSLSGLISITPKSRGGEVLTSLGISSSGLLGNIVHYSASGGVPYINYRVDTLVTTTGGQILEATNQINIM
jgi:hypothetical protein